MRFALLSFTICLVACGGEPRGTETVATEVKLAEPHTEAATKNDISSEDKEASKDTVRYINYSDEVLVEDLNGDGFPEVVSRVAEPKMNKIGVRVLDGREPDKFTVFGAGNEVDGMTNLLWIGSMKLIPIGETIAATLVDYETGDIIGPDTANQMLLENPAVLFLAKDTHGGGIMYWTGSEYAWMHLE